MTADELALKPVIVVRLLTLVWKFGARQIVTSVLLSVLIRTLRSDRVVVILHSILILSQGMPKHDFQGLTMIPIA